MLSLAKKKADVTDVNAHPVELTGVKTDPGVYSKLGWIIVLCGVGGAILWAALAPLDKGVPMSGTVAVAGNRKAVQHQTGGTIEKILVKEGDLVKQGQVLVKMNDTQAKANAEAIRVQYFNVRATQARLSAERDGKNTITYPQDLLDAEKKDARVATEIATQNQLLFARQSAINNELASYEENIAGLKVQVRGSEESRESKLAQKKIFEEQLGNMRELAKDGYIARGRLLELERTYAQLVGQMAEDSGNLGRARKQISELTLRRSQRQQEYQREVRTQLSEAQKEAEALRQRLISQEFESANSDVKAPADGIVVGMNVFTPGGVVGSGSKMMEIVPVDDGLIVEGQLAVNLVDKVHPGLPVELIFSAFNQNQTPNIPGEVIGVSADRLIEERTGTPYYKVKAKVAPAGLKMIRHLKIQPGMPVELFVKTGERTMMNYLFKPLFDRAKSALSEE